MTGVTLMERVTFFIRISQWLRQTEKFIASKYPQKQGCECLNRGDYELRTQQHF